MGPMQQQSLGGSRYILVFIDDFSHKSWTYFLKSKSETFAKFYNFKAKIEAQTGNKIQVLCSNCGGEYLSLEFTTYCAKYGIHRELTQGNTPQQNGVSERWNRTIMERARSLSSDCNLPVYLWPKAVTMATYLINCSPTRANSGIPPEVKFTGTSLDVNNLRIFGCIAYLHVPKDSCKKLDSKTQKCLFLGFDSETKAYKLYDNIRRKVIISCDVIFDEDKVGYQYLDSAGPIPDLFQFSSSDMLDSPSPVISQQPNFMELDTTHSDPTLNIPPTTTTAELESQPNNPESSTDSPTLEQLDFTNTERSPNTFPSTSLNPLSNPSSSPNIDSLKNRRNNPKQPLPVNRQAGPIARRYPSRNRTPSVKLRDFWTLVSEFLEEPLNFDDAAKQKDRKAAIQSEMTLILKNETWEVIDRSPGKTPITAKWIFKIKKNQNGDINKLKARVVARGFQQREGIDYHDILAPVVRWSTIRTILALAAKYQWPLY
jgi:hypothetical protein